MLGKPVFECKREGGTRVPHKATLGAQRNFLVLIIAVLPVFNEREFFASDRDHRIWLSALRS